MHIDGRKRIVVLEGLPASGKSTLADFLVKEAGFEKVNESLGELGGVTLSDDQRVIFADTLAKYAKAMRAPTSAVIDRGYPSMLAWDYCAMRMGLADDLDEKLDWVAAALDDGGLFEPDLYVYLESTPAISARRRPRPVTDKDVWSGGQGMNFYTEFCDGFFSQREETMLRLPASIGIEEAGTLILKKLRSHA